MTVTLKVISGGSACYFEKMYRIIKQLDFGFVCHLPKYLRGKTALFYHTDNGVFGHRPRKAVSVKIGMQSAV